MTMRGLGFVSASFVVGIPAALVRTTMSIGFSRTAAFVSILSTFVTAALFSGTVCRSLSVPSVMSARGVDSRCEGTGEAIGFAKHGFAFSGSMFSVLSGTWGSGDTESSGVGSGGRS